MTRLTFNFLCPVWGKDYVEQFLSIFAPSLLAPGNLPWLSARHDVVFSVLARRHDIGVYEAHPVFRAIAKLCVVRFVPIDDVIEYNRIENAGNAVFTLNCALQFGFLSEQRDHRDVNFVILNGDVLFADGCGKVLERVASEGYRAIVEAVFRANRDTLLPAIEQRHEETSLVLSPRELMRLGMQHLHPATAAYFWDNPKESSQIANHFYWRVGECGMISRCYLMHPLMVRPKVQLGRYDGFVDFACLPAAGIERDDIYVLTDSDEFARLEVAPPAYEQEFVEPRPYEPVRVAGELAKWTTELQRWYACHAIRYRVGDDPAQWKQIETETDRVVAGISSELERHPSLSPFGHPFWGATTSKFASFLEKRGIGKPTIIRSIAQSNFTTSESDETAALPHGQSVIKLPAHAGPLSDPALGWEVIAQALPKGAGRTAIVVPADSTFAEPARRHVSQTAAIDLIEVPAEATVENIVAALAPGLSGLFMVDCAHRCMSPNRLLRNASAVLQPGAQLMVHIPFLAAAMSDDGAVAATPGHITRELPKNFWQIDVCYFGGAPDIVMSALYRWLRTGCSQGRLNFLRRWLSSLSDKLGSRVVVRQQEPPAAYLFSIVSARRNWS